MADDPKRVAANVRAMVPKVHKEAEQTIQREANLVAERLLFTAPKNMKLRVLVLGQAMSREVVLVSESDIEDVELGTSQTPPNPFVETALARIGSRFLMSLDHAMDRVFK